MTHALMIVRNNIILTKRAAESAMSQDVPTMLYIVDNSDGDEVQEWMLDQPRARGWKMLNPKGVSASWNFGLKYLFETAGAEHVLVLNNDIVLRPDTMLALVTEVRLRCDAAKASLQSNYVPPFVTAVSVDNLQGIHGEWRKAPRPHPDFSCFLIRREVWDKVGPFDESMVLYASDADYHLRMHQSGIEAYTIGIPFYHYASGTLKSALIDERKRIEAQADADRAVFEAKWGCKVGSAEYYAMFGHGRPDAL